MEVLKDFLYETLTNELIGSRVKKKVKLILRLINYELCYKDIFGSGGMALPFLTSTLIEVSGQLHAQAALSPAKEPQ
jgi:3-phosphoglycerate kinase